MKQSLLESIDAKLKVLHDGEILKNMELCVQLLKETFCNGNKILIAGNGGSAADAQHFATEIVVRFKNERKGYPALALTSDPSILTATSNDYHFNALFARQVQALGKPGDVFIGISTSGNSENIIEGVKTAKKLGIKSVALLGKNGGKMKGLADISIIVPSDVTARIQESQITIIHIICEEVEKNFVWNKNKKTRLNEIISKISQQKIVVVGDIILDKYIWCDVERISPEAPVPVAKIRKENYVLGGAANVANNVQTLGAEVVLIGRIGKDENGKRIRQLLQEKNIQLNAVEDPQTPTTVKTRIVAGNQQLLRIDEETTESIGERQEEETIRLLSQMIPGKHAVIISDYEKGFVSESLARSVINEGKEKNIKVFADPKPESILKYKHAYLIKPNRKTTESLTGEKFDSNYSNLSPIAKKLQETLNVPNVIMTLGADGMVIYNGKDTKRIPTATKEVYDVSGAGDTTMAALAASIAAGANLEEAAILSNLAAGVVVGKRGTATCDRNELLKRVDEYES